jgi:hypothetical protein
MSYGRAWLGACALLFSFSAAGSLSAQPVFSPQGCDSLLIQANTPADSRAELDLGEGFVPFVANAQLLEMPPRGTSLALRYRLPDSEKGLPVYSREWNWTRAFPAFSAKLEEATLRLGSQASDQCPPDAWLIKQIAGDRVVDLLRIPFSADTMVLLDADDLTAVEIAWAGQRDWLELGLAAKFPVVPELPVEERMRPDAPWLQALSGDTLTLTATDSLCFSEAPAWIRRDERSLRLLPAGTDLEIWTNRNGVESARLVWKKPRQTAGLQIQSSPGNMLAVSASARQASTLRWLDASGSSGRLPLSGDTLLGPFPTGSLRLECIAEGHNLPLQTLNLLVGDPAPGELGVVYHSDSMLTLAPMDESIRNWEVQWRNAASSFQQSAAGSLDIHVAGNSVIRLRWRAGSSPYQSAWSSWQRITLVPDTPGAPAITPDEEGARLGWLAGSGPVDRIEYERLESGDTLRVIAAEVDAGLVDNAVLHGAHYRYRLRRVTESNVSAWTNWIGHHQPDASKPFLVSSRDLRASGLAFGSGPASDSPAMGLSPVEAMVYCNWLNTQMGFSGRYDLELASWLGTGFRMPSHEAEAGHASNRDCRVWVIDSGEARLAGSSSIRKRGSSKRNYSLAARPPDAAALLVFDAGEQP